MNFYVVSCCTCFRTASYASATSASWPTGAAPLSCLFAFRYSARHRKHSKKRQAPRTPLIFGSPPSVLDRWWSSRDSRLPNANFLLPRPPPLPPETTLPINTILPPPPPSPAPLPIASHL